MLQKDKSLGDVRRLSVTLRERGIESRTFWKPVHLQEPYRDAPRALTGVAESLWDRIITLPCSTGITDEELEYVVTTVKEEMAS